MAGAILSLYSEIITLCAVLLCSNCIWITLWNYQVPVNEFNRNVKFRLFCTNDLFIFNTNLIVFSEYEDRKFEVL